MGWKVTAAGEAGRPWEGKPEKTYKDKYSNVRQDFPRFAVFRGINFIDCTEQNISQAVVALKQAHPYEEPAYSVVKLEAY